MVLYWALLSFLSDLFLCFAIKLALLQDKSCAFTFVTNTECGLQVAVFCEHGNEHSGPIKNGEILD
jgi:hypothetical protein